jgi:putative protease
MAVWMRLSGSTEAITLLLHNGEGESVEVSHSGPFDVATKVEVARDSICSSLQKSGTSPFDVKDVELHFEGPTPFIPTGILNGLRREAMGRLEERLKESQPPKNIVPEDVNTLYPERTIGGDHNVTNSLSRQFYTDHGVERIDEGYDTLPDLEGVEVMRTPYCIRREIGHCLKKGSKLKEPLLIVHGTDRFRLRFDCKECMMYIEKMQNSKCKIQN